MGDTKHYVLQDPRGSKYPTFKDSGPKKPLRARFLGPETINIGCLDPLSMFMRSFGALVLLMLNRPSVS